MLEQFLPDPVHPVLDLVILDQAVLVLQLPGHLLAHFHLLFLADHGCLPLGHRQHHQKTEQKDSKQFPHSNPSCIHI